MAHLPVSSLMLLAFRIVHLKFSSKDSYPRPIASRCWSLTLETIEHEDERSYETNGRTVRIEHEDHPSIVSVLPLVTNPRFAQGFINDEEKQRENQQ